MSSSDIPRVTAAPSELLDVHGTPRMASTVQPSSEGVDESSLPPPPGEDSALHGPSVDERETDRGLETQEDNEDPETYTPDKHLRRRGARKGKGSRDVMPAEV